MPHSAIKKSLEKTGVGAPLSKIISCLIDNISTYVVSANGEVGPVPIKRGVRQGDPLSGVLFNIAFDQIIRALNSLSGVTVLVYADDILILADSPEALQAALDLLLVECTKLNLKINIDKCSASHLSGSPRECIPTIFTFDQIPIEYKLAMDPIVFLGKPIGFQLINDHSEVKEFYEKAYKILHYVLTPWQKPDALKTFFFPSLLYAQRTHQIDKKDWIELDNAIRAIIKKEVLSVPARASNEYLYGASADCLLGIPMSAEDSNIALIDGAYKVLTSNDEEVLEAAWKDLCQSVYYRIRSGHHHTGSVPPPLSYNHLSSFLSGDRLLGANQNISLFTQARIAFC